ncbi:SDR family NAD(P)-dependent oxidoreductase [Enterovibrio coralii]|uniref:Cell-cell signaling protein CsgA n=1 Tax=Enterovibrio coralii TaxID=294935 RepID=A0A135IDC4_9GAMM|nr:SDR family NAD(P)-dependent oxidoreductase [Enterovibrio coralii]KXF83462.1 cell-cell signaling protein CsgA [Enterovibrio coralii]
MKERSVLVVGSHGTIGQAIVLRLRELDYHVLTISRRKYTENPEDHLQIDCSNADCVGDIQAWLRSKEHPVDGVIHCAGMLHGFGNDKAGSLPEKKLGDLNTSNLLEAMKTNVMSHVHAAQAVSILLKRSQPFKWISLSAKVGSIEDNALGGWYSYRMSKAALNMMIKNLSIEWKRRAPHSTVVAVHPGTTPSELSEPFLENHPPDLLYSPALTAQRMVEIYEALTPETSGRLLHHDGSAIPW